MNGIGGANLMTDDLSYLVNYKPNALYTVPAKNGKGAYAKLVGENERLLGEIDVRREFIG